MSKNISVSDLLQLKEFKGLKEFDFLPISFDIKVKDILHELGIDINKGYTIVYQRHRNAQNKIVDGYMYQGYVRADLEYRNSPFCSMEDRIIMTGSKDISLTKELSKLQGGGGSTFLSTDDEIALEAAKEVLYPDQYNEDATDAEKKILLMQNIVDSVRGSCYSESGNLKSFTEWQESEENVVTM